MDREAALAAIVEEARKTRKRTPRWMWIAALLVSVVCVGALAIAWFESGSDNRIGVGSGSAVPVSNGIGGGLGLGLMIGIGVGIAIGGVIGVRRRDS